MDDQRKAYETKIRTSLENFEDMVHSKLLRIKHIMWLEIYGYPGAEKQIPFVQDRADEKIKKSLEKFDEEIKSGLNDLHDAVSK